MTLAAGGASKLMTWTPCGASKFLARAPKEPCVHQPWDVCFFFVFRMFPNLLYHSGIPQNLKMKKTYFWETFKILICHSPMICNPTQIDFLFGSHFPLSHGSSIAHI